MRHLHTIAFAAVLALSSQAGLANAQPSDQAADRTTNRELLALPYREQRLWVNAFMVGASTALSLRDVEAGRCVAHWYFADEAAAFASMQEGFEAYPDERPTPVILAYARRACPSLVLEGG